MDGTRDDLLAHAALARDEYRALVLRRPFNQLEDVLHGGRDGHECPAGPTLAELLAQTGILALQALPFLRLANGQEELLRLEGFGEVVVGSETHRLERLIHIGVRGHHENSCAWLKTS